MGVGLCWGTWQLVLVVLSLSTSLCECSDEVPISVKEHSYESKHGADYGSKKLNYGGPKKLNYDHVERLQQSAKELSYGNVEAAVKNLSYDREGNHDLINLLGDVNQSEANQYRHVDKDSEDVRTLRKLGYDHEEQELNALHSVSKSVYEILLYAGPGQFLTVLSIGTPPVNFTAIVDTGSELIWRQCKPCIQCYQQAHDGFPIFDPSLSRSYRKAPCNDPLCIEAQSYGGSCIRNTCIYNSLYIDPSAYTQGDLSYDTLSISDVSGRKHKVPGFGFGCSHKSYGPYNFAGAGGILGLGLGKLALPAQLGVKKFSYCMTRMGHWDLLSSSIHDGGHDATPLLLGDSVSLPGDGYGVQRTPILPNEDEEYRVQLEHIRVNGKRLNVSKSVFSKGGTIIDSGTTFTTLAGPAFLALRSTIASLIPLTPRALPLPPRNLSLCYSSLPSHYIPSVSFYFKGARLDLPPNNVFISIDNQCCLAFLQSADSGSVYGNVQQQDFHILYDLSSWHISFKPTSCHSITRSF